MIDPVRLGDAWDEVDVRVGAEVRELLAVSQSRGVIPKAQISDAPARADSFAKYKICEAGDLVLNRFNAYRGAFGRATSSGMVSPDYLVLRPHRDQDGRYLEYLIRSHYVASELIKGMGGIGGNDPDSSGFSRMDTHSFHRIPVAKWGLQDQRAIADYLDRETARIDTLVEEQQRLIEMLRERREVEIRHTLLVGVDQAPAKFSGVALLGEIPRHWQMVPARYLCTITTGSKDSGNATEDGEYPFYVRGREVLSIDRYSFDGEAVMTPGDGQGGTGKVFHYFDGKFEAHQRVYVFKDFDGVTGPFFYYFLSTFLRPVALAGSNTVTMESLRRPLLADFKVAVPPMDEQRRITTFLDEQTAKTDELIAETEHFIELSRERRAALITAAVTGQIDVREVA